MFVYVFICIMFVYIGIFICNEFVYIFIYNIFIIDNEFMYIFIFLCDSIIFFRRMGSLKRLIFMIEISMSI